MWPIPKYLLSFWCMSSALGFLQDQLDVATPTIALLDPQGIQFSYPDSPGVSFVAFHYNINKPLINVAAGDHNYDVVAKTGDQWVYSNPNVAVKPGDEIHYWMNVVQNGQGLSVTDQVWIVPQPTTTPVSTLKYQSSKQTETDKTTLLYKTSVPSFNGQTYPLPAQTPSGGQGVNTGTSVGPDGGKESGTSVDQNGGKDSGTSVVPDGGKDTGSTTDTGPERISDNGNVAGSVSGSCGCVGSSNRPPGADITCITYPCLIFNEEFDYLNFDVWEHEITASGGGNWEFEYYTNNRTNSYTRDGKLFIKPTFTIDTINDGPDGLAKGSLDLWGGAPGDVCTGNAFWGCKRDGTPDHIINPIQSARLRSLRGFNFKYGKVEVRAKLPKGDWIWPAIWMLPYREAYGKWPASGEIDIVESRGNSEQYKSFWGKSMGRNVAGSTLHFGSDYFHNKYAKAHGEKVMRSGTFADDFHNYTLIWDENFIRTYIDGHLVLDVTPRKTMWEYGGNDKDGVENPWRHATKMAPFDQEFYFILNVAVGGVNYFPDNSRYTVHKPWSDKSEFTARDFWNARSQWYPTWNPHVNNGEDAAMQVDYIKVWKLKPNSKR